MSSAGTIEMAVAEQVSKCISEEGNNKKFCEGIGNYLNEVGKAIVEAAANGCDKEQTYKTIDKSIGHSNDGSGDIFVNTVKEFGKASSDFLRGKSKMPVSAANLANEQGRLLALANEQEDLTKAVTAVARNSGRKMNSKTILLCTALVIVMLAMAAGVYMWKKCKSPSDAESFPKPESKLKPKQSDKTQRKTKNPENFKNQYVMQISKV